MKGLLYRLTFANGKAYIGITTKSLAQRVRQHVNTARAGAAHALSRAIRKYGTFRSEVLVVADIEYLKAAEIRAIEAFGTRRKGYNMSLGGDTSPMEVPAIRAAMSGPAHHFYGKRFSAEYRAKLVAAAKNRARYYPTPEHKAKIAATLRGHAVAQETRDKIAASLRGRCA